MQAGVGAEHSKEHTDIDVLYWVCLRRGGSQHGDRGGRPCSGPGFH